jgi:hypothetical protein
MTVGDLRHFLDDPDIDDEFEVQIEVTREAVDEDTRERVQDRESSPVFAFEVGVEEVLLLGA